MDNDERELDAIHENDLAEVLRKIGYYDRLLEGTLKCKFCNSQITMENIHSILPQVDGFSFICDKPECVETLVKYLNEKNSTRINQL